MRVATRGFEARIFSLALLALAGCTASNAGSVPTAGNAGSGSMSTSTAGTAGGGAGSSGSSGSTGSGLAGNPGAAGGSPSGGASGAPAGGSGGSLAGTSGGSGQSGATGAAGAGGGAGASVMGSLTFTRKTLHMLNYAEGIGVGDFNKDGHVDVNSGPFWWEGPAFDKRHQYFPPPASNAYTDKTLGDWADYDVDVDNDGWVDSINIMRPGTPSYWYKNPGKPGIDADISAWSQQVVGTLVMEQSAFTDLTGEGKPQLIGAIEGKTGWFDVGASSPWTFTQIGVSGATVAYAWWHGIGTGDLDGDGKQDLLTDTAWYSRPAGGARAGLWIRHPQVFKGDGVAADQGPSQMFGYDVDGDGDDDVVTALDAHGYGVAWYENNKGTFTRHIIVGGAGSTATNAGMIAPFSQPHAMWLADVDGDGLKDLITGKSFYAHPPGMGDPDADGTPVFYVFKLVRGAQGVTWQPHLVDSVVGLGRQFTTADLNGDGKIDIAVASKHGAFLFFQQ
jgi:hypothetical protein